jgi:predicted glycosyltransferase
VAAADAVVTMGGYNSVWEAVGAGKRPIIVPLAEGSEEQPLRAQRLADLGLATVLPLTELTPRRMAAAMLAELARGVTPAATLDFDGLDRAGVALATVLRRGEDGIGAGMSLHGAGAERAHGG